MINNLLIFGDSYSTYAGEIPDGYAAYYYPTVVDPDNPVRTMRLDETWWRRFIKRTDANLIRNDSWSGSTICYTGYDGDCSSTSSFIYRYRRLCREGFFDKNKIDTVIVFGGTNDSWVPAPLGDAKLADWSEDDLAYALPAIAYFMSKLKSDLPKSRIVFIANCDINPEIVNCMKTAGAHFGVEVVQLSELEKINGHPTPLGMEQIVNQVLLALGED